MCQLQVVAVIVSLAGPTSLARAPGSGPPAGVIPKAIEACSSALLDTILDDPKGGEFSEVVIPVRVQWQGKAMNVKATGWVFRDAKGAPVRVVCWNGLAYKPLSVGERKDVTQVVKNRLAAPYLMGSAIEGQEVADCATCLGSVILRHLGDEKDADSIAQKLGRDVAVGSIRDAVWFRFNRAVAAHMVGDDPGSGQDASRLAAALPRLEKVLREEGLGNTGAPLAGVDAAQIAALAEDSQRRLGKARGGTADLTRLAKLPAKEQIPKLIGLLDEVTARQWGQPGGVDIVSDPIVQAVIAVGEEAVDALLDCADHDRRLTRSVSFGRDSYRGRNLISVRDAAMAATTAILHTTAFSRDEKGFLHVKDVLHYWNKMRSHPFAGRLYLTLADDEALPEQWLEAASMIVQRVDMNTTGAWIGVPNRKPGARLPPMRGESLRRGMTPSVTDLMAKRAGYLADSAADPGRGFDMLNLEDGVKIAGALCKWDPEGSRVVVGKVYRAAGDLVAKWSRGGAVRANLITYLTNLVLRRLAGGDPDAPADYERLMLALDLRDSSFVQQRWFLPLWKYPAQTRAVADHLLAGSDSPWLLSKLMASKAASFSAAELVASPLSDVPTFRDVLIGLLRDKTVIGKVTRADGGHSTFETDKGARGNRGYPADPADKPGMSAAVGVDVPYRLCDQIMENLPSSGNLPLFRPYWLEGFKDAAIARYIERLKNPAPLCDWYKYGDRWWMVGMED